MDVAKSATIIRSANVAYAAEAPSHEKERPSPVFGYSIFTGDRPAVQSPSDHYHFLGSNLNNMSVAGPDGEVRESQMTLEITPTLTNAWLGPTSAAKQGTVLYGL